MPLFIQKIRYIQSNKIQKIANIETHVLSSVFVVKGTAKFVQLEYSILQQEAKTNIFLELDIYFLLYGVTTVRAQYIL
jgi:hypothetical protein